uniref:Uncharacterized protein n=1 Tax=Anopheles minimus TaxID=112268 RepID=A0A182WMQ5_9DIPT
MDMTLFVRKKSLEKIIYTCSINFYSY